MPRLNGIEFLTEIRKDSVLKDLNVFIRTTSTEEVEKEAAKESGVSGYIKKKPLYFEKFGGENGATVDILSLQVDLLTLKYTFGPMKFRPIGQRKQIAAS